MDSPISELKMAEDTVSRSQSSLKSHSRTLFDICSEVIIRNAAHFEHIPVAKSLPLTAIERFLEYVSSENKINNHTFQTLVQFGLGSDGRLNLSPILHSNTLSILSALPEPQASVVQEICLKNCISLSDSVFKSLLSRCPSLLSLDISNCIGISADTLRQIPVLCPLLRSLKAKNLPEFDGSCLLSLAAHASRSLQILHCENGGMNDSIPFQIFLDKCGPNLIELDLDGGFDLYTLFTYCPNLKFMRRLSHNDLQLLMRHRLGGELQGNCMFYGSFDITSTPAILSHFPHLKHITACGITVPFARHILLEYSPNRLTHLSLTVNSDDDDDSLPLFQSFQSLSLPLLSSLSLKFETQSTSLTAHTHIFSACQNLTKLQYGPAHQQFINDTIEMLPELTSLSCLSFQQPAPPQPKQIITLCAPNLKKLKIENTRGIFGFRFKDCRSLASLSIDSCSSIHESDALDLESITTIASDAKQVEKLTLRVHLKSSDSLLISRSLGLIASSLCRLRLFESEVYTSEVSKISERRNEILRNHLIGDRDEDDDDDDDLVSTVSGYDYEAEDAITFSLERDWRSEGQSDEDLESRARKAAVACLMRDPDIMERTAEKREERMQRIEAIDTASHQMAQLLLQNSNQIQSLKAGSCEFESIGRIVAARSAIPSFHPFESLVSLSACISLVKQVHLTDRQVPVLQHLELNDCYNLEQIRLDGLSALYHVKLRLIGMNCEEVFISESCNALRKLELDQLHGITGLINLYFKQLADSKCTASDLQLSSGYVDFDRNPKKKSSEKQQKELEVLQIGDLAHLERLQVSNLGNSQALDVQNCPSLRDLAFGGSGRLQTVTNAPLLESLAFWGDGGDSGESAEENPFIVEMIVGSADDSTATAQQPLSLFSSPSICANLKSISLESFVSSSLVAKIGKACPLLQSFEATVGSSDEPTGIHVDSFLSLIDACRNLQVLKLKTSIAVDEARRHALPCHLDHKFVCLSRGASRWDPFVYVRVDVEKDPERVIELIARAERDRQAAVDAWQEEEARQQEFDQWDEHPAAAAAAVQWADNQ